MNKIFPSRFTLIKGFVLLFLSVSFIIRAVFFIWNFSEVDKDLWSLAKVFGVGFFFDIGTVSFFMVIASLYFLIMPRKLYGSWLDRVFCYLGFGVGILITYFSFFAEITFWDEFHRRFNFIAVDYLIYTYEVVKNINESYPLPILIGGMLLLVISTIFLFYRKKVFTSIFKSSTSFKQKLIPTFIWVFIALFFTQFIGNKNAEIAENRYNNELSKAGIYSFFSAFRNNELSYHDFYKTTEVNNVFNTIRREYAVSGDSLTTNPHSIKRMVRNAGTEDKPNVIFICVESLSAKFLGAYGNQDHLTPTLDSLAKHGVTFTNLFATGTRTVRGMEAITLSIPPTPGRSIVKREQNTGLFTIGEVFRNKGYSRTFFYGGDGYFDNMDKYFSGNGFDIVDRGRGFLPSSDIVTSRKNIEDEEVIFENAWGVCDEDIYSKVLKEADLAFETGKPFFDFVMTTSNHKPYTYPEGKIDIASGTGRSGAIKYTDYAIGKFFQEAKKKKWFKNTVFVIMADHCASSAGRWELDVANYHIPAIIVNLKGKQHQNIDQLCSQIDILPTLFNQFHWDYESNLFGMDVFKMNAENERAFIGNYRKLGLLKENKIMVLGDQKSTNFYSWNKIDNSLNPLTIDDPFLNETISYFQAADFLFQNKGLTIKE